MNTPSQLLSKNTATILIINAMIGAGIFSIPMAIQATAGPAGILTCMAVVGAVWCLAVSLGRVAEQTPRAHSFYDYVAPWAGHYMGMLITLSYTAGIIVGMSLLTRITGMELHKLFPQFSVFQQSLTILAIIALTIMQGVVVSSFGQRLLIVGTVTPMVIIIGLCLANGSIANFFPFAPHGILPAILAMKTIIFGFFGFECVTSLAPLLRNPAKEIPSIVTRAVTSVGLIYVLFIGSVMYATPEPILQASNGSLITLLLTRFPDHPWLIWMVIIAILSAIIGTIHAMLWSATILISGNRIFSQMSAPAAQKITVSVLAILILTLSSILVDIDTFFSITALCVVPAYFCSTLTIFMHKQAYDCKTRVYACIGLLATACITGAALYDLAQRLIH